MKALAIVLAVAGCHDFPKHQADASVDGQQTFPIADAATEGFCTAALGTANLSASDGVTNLVEGRLDGGATLESGPFHATAPLQLSLLFVNDDPLDPSQAQCCVAGDFSCCGIDGLVATSQTIAAGTEVGDHGVTVTRIEDASFTVAGTLTITSFTNPFDKAPGEIAGSITASDGQHTVSGTLDGSFCSQLLFTTI